MHTPIHCWRHTGCPLEPTAEIAEILESILFSCVADRAGMRIEVHADVFDPLVFPIVLG